MAKEAQIVARGVVSYVAVRIGGLGPTRLGRLLHVSRQSVLRGVQIGAQLMVKTGGAELVLVVTDVTDISDLRPSVPNP